MPPIVLALIAFLALSVRAEALPLSASLDGFSVGGSTDDTTLAPDCLPGKVCESTQKRKIELKLPVSGTPEQKVPIEVIVIPEIPGEKIAPIEAILKEKLPNEGEELFKVLEPEVPKLEEEFLEPHLKIGVIKNPAELPEYKSSLEELTNELLYKGEGSFVPGHHPRGMALVLFNPETKEGFAVVTLFASVPLPMSLLLMVAGLGALPLLRRA